MFKTNCFRVRSDSVLSEDQDLAASPVPEGEHEVRAGDRVRLHADGCQRGRIPHQEGDARSRRVHHRGGSNIVTCTSWFRHCSFDYRLRLSLISAMSMEMVQSIWMNLLVIFYLLFFPWLTLKPQTDMICHRFDEHGQRQGAEWTRWRRKQAGSWRRRRSFCKTSLFVTLALNHLYFNRSSQKIADVVVSISVS